MKLKISVFFIVFWWIFSHSVTYSQTINEIEFRTGPVFFDSRVSEGDLFKSSNGWGSQVDLSFYKTFDLERKFKPTIGIGYTNLYYWDVDFFDSTPIILEPPYSYVSYGGDRTSHYLNLRYGLDINIYKEKFGINLLGSHYLLMHRSLQAFNQKRIFMNVDIGLKYQMNRKCALTVSTPFAIHPIVQDPVKRNLNQSNNPKFERFVEMNGVLVGLRYKINN